MLFRSGANTTYGSLGWAWPNQCITPVWEPNPENYWDELQTFNNTATPSNALGFSADVESVTNEITACTNVVSKYHNALMSGSVDVDETLPKFISELQGAGIDKIVDLKNTQYAAWKN